MKYAAEFIREFSKRTVFSSRDVELFFKKAGMGRPYLHQFIHNLLKNGRLKRIAKGRYTFRDEVQIVGFAYPPFYYGLQEALSLRNLWEQETNPIVITTGKIRGGVKNFEGRNYIVRRIKREMFFGFEMVKYYDFWVPVSDIEKTIIDFAYFKEPIPANALKSAKSKIERSKMEKYLKRCPIYLRKRVMRHLKWE